MQPQPQPQPSGALSSDELQFLRMAIERSRGGGARVPLSRCMARLVDRRTAELRVPRVDAQTLAQLQARLEAPPFAGESNDASEAQLAAVIGDCLELLRQRAMGASAHAPLAVLVCRANNSGAPAAPIGSPGDTAVQPGCDAGASRDWDSKTDTHTVWVSQRLLGRAARTQPQVVLQAAERVRSFTLFTVLHEFAHVWVDVAPQRFAALFAFYGRVVAALQPVPEWIYAGGADAHEFVCDAFAALNAR